VILGIGGIKTGRGITGPWDVTEHLVTEEDMVAYLEAAWEGNCPSIIIRLLVEPLRLFHPTNHLFCRHLYIIFDWKSAHGKNSFR
jgi:hypothetical protein